MSDTKSITLTSMTLRPWAQGVRSQLAKDATHGALALRLLAGDTPPRKPSNWRKARNDFSCGTTVFD